MMDLIRMNERSKEMQSKWGVQGLSEPKDPCALAHNAVSALGLAYSDRIALWRTHEFCA